MQTHSREVMVLFFILTGEYFPIDFQREGRERDREKHQRERDTLMGCLLPASDQSQEPATEVRALDQNGTWDLQSTG